MSWLPNPRTDDEYAARLAEHRCYWCGRNIPGRAPSDLFDKPECDAAWRDSLVDLHSGGVSVHRNEQLPAECDPTDPPPSWLGPRRFDTPTPTDTLPPGVTLGPLGVGQYTNQPWGVGVSALPGVPALVLPGGWFTHGPGPCVLTRRCRDREIGRAVLAAPMSWTGYMLEPLDNEPLLIGLCIWHLSLLRACVLNDPTLQARIKHEGARTIVVR